MVSTDGRTDTEGYNIIPRHTLVAGYKKATHINSLGLTEGAIKAGYNRFKFSIH